MKVRSKPIPRPASVRVAVYTRKSTEEGLDQEFNTLDAQREAVLAFVASQRSEGWVALPERYDDGGFTGANTDRPAFQRLLRDIEAGGVDVVAVYKIDRLSRSLLDFARVMDTFDRHAVTFVSVTQQFSTANSMGKLTLNILMSFAEFERQVISERTRDKMVAARRRGMWTGGRPVLGYDVRDKKLVVNVDEAEQVRTAFQLYLESGSLLATAHELGRRGIRMKAMRGKGGRVVPGAPFRKNSLSALLRNPIYRGLVRVGNEVVPGAHEAIVDQKTWDAVQAQLREHRRDGGAETRNKWGALLRRLLFCGRCGRAMVHHVTAKHGRAHRSYVCATAMERGAAACQGSRVPAVQIEEFVIAKLAAMGADPELVAATAAAAHQEAHARAPELAAEVRRLTADGTRLHAERRNLLDAVAHGGPAVGALLQRVGELEGELGAVEERAAAAREDLARVESGTVDEGDMRAALAAFAPLWAELVPRERERVLRLLVDRVAYDGAAGEIEIKLRAGGLKTLAAEAGRQSA